MAMRLQPEIVITDHDELGACAWCGSPDRDPDEMDKWAAHLAAWHGYRLVEDRPRPSDASAPRTIRLELVGWTEKAKFAVNQRVTVKADSRPRDYAGRRGTVTGKNPAVAEYAVAFDEDPLYGVLASNTLDAYTPTR